MAGEAGIAGVLDQMTRFNLASWRRISYYGLAVLAIVLLSCVAAIMMMDDPLLADAEAFPDAVVLADKRPDIVFPESVRTADLTLNRFVDRFARVCMQGKYSDLRLMLSSRGGDPLVASRFESMFNALKQVRILVLDRVANLPDAVGPVYVMKAEYVLEDYAAAKGRRTEQVRLAIAKEDGGWRIGPIPRGIQARFDGSESASPHGSPEGRLKADDAGSTPPPPAPAAEANRPAALGS